jgi:hypothetical protein
VVNSLATTGSWYSDEETSSTTALPSSALTITTTPDRRPQSTS